MKTFLSVVLEEDEEIDDRSQPGKKKFAVELDDAPKPKSKLEVLLM
jgi:hypothetical protein